ncbi:LuxR C-terminal-related transcriptional regulator [Billgrantia endophytica]|uniref:Helix-turn-helix transcriptional regulator n=1 Tax=Billgrantia endophytica TaxID=2033802 RepID=A0A2N7U2N6_9GAMM|nr:LuxR C-terminal-related transcriptional regulator [Halomonas endophytica]PMR74704.1 helix-turn-helix transcriptional regulator [Halomonas endophytica]
MGVRKGLILLVTDHNPQSQLFVDYIQQQVDCPVSIAPPNEDSCYEDETGVVVLMDADHVDESAMQLWQSKTANNPKVFLTAFNLKDEEHAAELLTFMHIKGVFYRNDSLELICKGIATLFDGDLWMSRSLMTRLIEFFRRQQLNSYRPACGLTQRELEIIGLLGSGASNIEIAERLFVSEHTVKSHLYNIFRKINVHNRIQAVNWARQNLGAPPPLTPLRHNKLYDIR